MYIDLPAEDNGANTDQENNQTEPDLVATEADTQRS